MSPGLRPVSPGRNTLPSISGASQGERAMASSFSVSISSTSTSISRPTLDWKISAEICCWASMNRSQRSCFTVVGHLRKAEVIGLGAGDGLVLEAADTLEARFAQPGQEIFEIVLGLAGEADDEGGADGDVRADLPPGGQAVQHLLLIGRAAHGLEHSGRGVLEGNVEVGKDLARGHQRDDVIHMRVGIDIVHPHPGAEVAQFLGHVVELRAHLAAVELRRPILDVDAIGAGVLADDQQFLDAGLDQPLGLVEHRGHGAGNEIAADRGDDAEGAAVVAALGNLQIGIVPRRQVQALRRHQIEARVMQRRKRLVHGTHDRLVLVRAGYREHARMGGADGIGLDAVAAGDDDASVLGHGLADRGQRFGLGAVEEAAGVDDHHIRVVIAGRNHITLGPELGDDAFAVDQGLGATEGYEADFGDMLVHGRPLAERAPQRKSLQK